MPMTPFMGVRISWLTLARKLLLARLAASAASLASMAACPASLRSVMSSHRTRKPRRVAGGVALGLSAQAHPFVVAGLVLHSHVHVERDIAVQVVVHDGLRGEAVVGMDQFVEAFAGAAEFARAEPQQFLEARSEPRFIAGNVELPHAVARGAHGARQTLLERILRGVERLGGVAQPFLPLLVLGDLGDGADGARRETFRILDHLTASCQPAQPAVQQQRSILGLELAARGNRIVEPLHQLLIIFGMNGGQPFAAREGHVPVLEVEKTEERRRAGQLAGDEVEIEHAQAARGVREFQEFGGPAQLCLAFAAAVDGVVQTARQRLDFIAARRVLRIRCGSAIEQTRHGIAERAQALRDVAGGNPGGDEQCEDGSAEGGGGCQAPVQAEDIEHRPRQQNDCEEGYREQFSANRPTSHAASKPVGERASWPLYRPVPKPLEL